LYYFEGLPDFPLSTEDKIIQVPTVMKVKGQKIAGLKNPSFEPIQSAPMIIKKIPILDLRCLSP
jgi:hypothetical protein